MNQNEPSFQFKNQHALYMYRPIRFFSIVLLATWIFGFIAAYCSYHKGMEGIQLLFMGFGLFSPFITALMMIYSSENKQLRKDLWKRLSFYGIKLKSIPILLLLMPCTVVLATLISLLFWQPIEQFNLSNEFNIMKGHGILSLVILLSAPTLEELGWRGYGVDSIRANFNLFTTTILFAGLWALWHLPLFFINGYYQHELWNMSIIYVINFFVSFLPATILMNWIYYKNNRNIIVAILLHFMFDLCSVISKTEQFTKCIITVFLLLVSIIILIKDKELFFSND